MEQYRPTSVSRRLQTDDESQNEMEEIELHVNRNQRWVVIKMAFKN